MTNLLNDNLRNLMSQYKLKVVAAPNNEDLLCSLCHNLMMNPYQSHCGCQYCHVCIAEYLADGEKNCQGGKEECQEEYLMLEKNVSRSSILDKKVSKVKVHCPKELCQCITELKGMEEHMKICKQRFTECPYTVIGCGTEGAANDKIMAHLNDDKLVHSQLLIGLFNNLKDEFAALKEIHENERIEGDNLKRKMTLKIEDLKDELKRTKTILSTVRPNVASFTVDRFSARKTAKEKMFSPFFYSHTNGYKLRLLVCPGGFNESDETNLVVILHMCKGQYDDLLPWPCRRTFTIGITDQIDGETHVNDTFSYDTIADEFKDVFIKPGRVRRRIGFPIFVSHANLYSLVGLVVDDSVIVRCAVNDSPSPDTDLGWQE